MLLVETGTAGVISAYFYRHITSGYSLNVSDPIDGQPVQLSYHLCVFGCGLVFWLLVLLWAKLHDSGDRQADIRKVAKLAKVIAPITTLNLCGCLLVPFMKLPLLVRFLVLFQVSSNLALLLFCAFLSLKEYMISLDAHTQQQISGHGIRCPPPRGRVIRRILLEIFWPRLLSPGEQLGLPKGTPKGIWKSQPKGTPKGVWKSQPNSQSGTSGSGHGNGASGRDENGGRYGGNDGGGGAGGGGDRGVSGSGHGSGAGGSGGGSEGGDTGRDGGGNGGASGSGHGNGASGSGGGGEGGDTGRDGGGADPESGGRGTNTEQAFESSKIIKMSITLTAQTTGTLMGFHSIPTPSSSSKVLLVVALMDQLVAYLCGVTGILLSSNKPEDSKAAKIFAQIGFVCYTLGYILMIAMYVAMYVPWYSVSIVVLLFGVVWLILFRNGLKTRATQVWNYLKNSTQSIKNCIGMLFESGS